MSTTLTNANKTILQTSFPPRGPFYQMYDEENGKEKGKKEDVKHRPEVEKKVSPAFRCPPWFFSYVKKERYHLELSKLYTTGWKMNCEKIRG